MEELAQKMRHKAMDWLGRREYSRYELAVKLRRWLLKSNRRAPLGDKASVAGEQELSGQGKGPTAEQEALLTETLHWLEERQFLSDERCARLYVRSHIERGYGPLRIRQELVFRRGLAEQLVEAELEASACDWFAQAAQVLRRRFRHPPESLKEKARQLRFIQRRGFPSECCYQALDVDEADT